MPLLVLVEVTGVAPPRYRSHANFVLERDEAGEAQSPVNGREAGAAAAVAHFEVTPYPLVMVHLEVCYAHFRDD